MHDTTVVGDSGFTFAGCLRRLSSYKSRKGKFSFSFILQPCLGQALSLIKCGDPEANYHSLPLPTTYSTWEGLSHAALSTFLFVTSRNTNRFR